MDTSTRTPKTKTKERDDKETRDVASDARTPALGHHPRQGRGHQHTHPQNKDKERDDKETRDVASDARTPALGHHP